MSGRAAKQTTLFQSWGRANSATASGLVGAVLSGSGTGSDQMNSGKQSHTSNDQRIDGDGDFNEDELLADFNDDELLAAAAAMEMDQISTGQEWNSYGQISNSMSTVGSSTHYGGSDAGSSAANDDGIAGFDHSAGNLWIYPTNYPIRDYQYNIVQQALFKNTMVTLPTGLGKTFIAAVVMYNFYRWYPQGKIAFMAPTKPLVAQQIEACYNIMGIPQDHTAEMTGSMPPTERLRAWKEKRVFFLTPQVMMNDLSRGACPSTEVKCLVIDEAHKALGNHAYCQVVKELVRYTQQFRVLSLSATPGGDIKGVQQVLNNLLISHVEIRSEESIDIQPYVHERKVEKMVVKLDEEIKEIKDRYVQILSIYVNRLIQRRVLYKREVTSLSKFMILKAREDFRCNPPTNIQGKAQQGMIEGDFAMSISLYHGYELLLQHGMRSLYSFLQSMIDGSKGTSRARSELSRNPEFISLLDTLRDKYQDDSNQSVNVSGLFSTPGKTSVKPTNKPFVISHPKMGKLREVVLEHFHKSANTGEEDGVSTRIMIFSQYRDSVQEITDMLNQHQPTVQVMSFIGQASAGKNTKGFSQKEQLRVVKAFRQGGYNTLVSTCVGEEGLDIGDVDLIICYDAHKSPIRLVQRMGRTGRKRQGRIVMLVTEGKEESIYNQSQLNKKSIHRAMKGNKSLQLYPHNPRMVPHGINPVVHKMHITMDKYQSKSAKKKSLEKKRTSGGSVKALFAKGRKMIKENGFLSEEELQYWNDHYKVSETVKQLPTRGKITCLAAGSNEDSKKVGNVRNELSLTEWKEWQNTKQATKLIAHSKQCCNFVELMEFIELQQQMGDEDNYGLEMMAYLNMDDVVQPGKQKKYGNEQYYIADNPSDSKGNAKEALSRQKLKKRACVILDSSDSDDDLPDAEMKRTIETGKKNVSNTDLEFGKMKDKKEKKCNSDKKKKSRSKKAGNKAVCVTPIITDTQSDFEIDRCNISDEQVKRKENKKISNDDTAHQMKERDNETSPLKCKGAESDRRRSDSKIDIEIGAESKNDNNTATDRQRRKISDQDENVKGLSSSDLDLSSIFPSFSQRNSKHNSVPVNDKDGFVVAVPPSLDSLSDLEDLDFPESTLPGFRNGSEMEDDELTNESNNHAKELKEEEDVDLKKENFGEKFQNPTDTLKKTMTQAVPSLNQICENLKFDCDEKEFSKEVFISEVKDNSKDEDRISQIYEDGDMFDIDVEDNDEPDCLDILTPQVTVKLAESSEDTESTVKVAELDKDHVGDTEFGKNWQEKTMDSLCVSKSQIQVDKVEQTEHQIKNRNSSVSWTPGTCNSEDIPPANTSESRSQPIPDSVKDSGVGELKYKNTDRKDCCNNDNSVNIQSKDQNCPLSQQTYSKCAKNNMESTCMTIGPSHSGMECYASTARKEVYYREHQTLDGFEPNFDLKFDFSHLDEEHNELVDVVPPSPSNKPSQSIWLKSSTGITKTMNKAKKLPLHSVGSTNKYKQLQFTNATHTQPPVKQNDSLRKGHVKSSSRQHWISLNTSPENTSVLTNNRQLKSDKQSKRPLNSKKSPTGGFAALSVDNFENEQSNISLQHRSILKRKSYSPTVDKLKSDSYKRRKSSSPIGSPLFTASSLSKTPDVHTVMKDSPNTPCTGMAMSPVNSRNKSSTPLGRVLPSRVESVISPIEITKTPTSSKSFDSDSDDSIVGPRKKKKANVLWSPDTPTVARKQLNGASSVDKKQRTKRTPITPLFSAVIDSEDEFVDPVNAKSDKRPSPKDNSQYAATKDGNGHERKRHSSEFSKGNKISKKAKRKRHDTEVVRGFLDEEAEVSDDIEEYSSDENGESDDIDTSLEEFINDATQISPDCTNMRQIYAQSLHPERGKSMAAGPVASRYKMVYKQLGNDDMEIFSQEPVQDQSYEEDSFCINSNEDDEESFHDNSNRFDALEHTINLDNILDGKRRTRGRRLYGSNQQKVTCKEKSGNRPRRRIISCDSSSDEEIVIIMDSDDDLSAVNDQFSKPEIQHINNKHFTNTAVTNQHQKTQLQTCQVFDTPQTGYSDSSKRISTVKQASERQALKTNTDLMNRKSLLRESRNNGLDGTICQQKRQREERLKRQREKQLLFKRKLEETKRRSDCVVKNTTTEFSPSMVLLQPGFPSATHGLLNQKNEAVVGRSKLMVQAKSITPGGTTTIAVDSIANGSKPVVLVDSREISSSNIVSTLRLKHQLNVTVCQLSGCDFIVSQRIGVERKAWSDFANGANRAKLVDRLRHLCELYDRPCLIIEKDRIKPKDDRPKQIIRNKYIDSTLAALTKTHIKVIFSESQDESADIIADLVKLEQRKGNAVIGIPEMNPLTEQILKWYTSIPRVSYVTALVMLKSFTSVADMIQSSPERLQQVLGIGESKAKEIHQYICHVFDAQMLAIK